MFFFLSKSLPLLVYPVGLTCLLILAALWLHRHTRWQTLFLLGALMLLGLGGNRLITMTLVSLLERQHLPPATLPERSVVVVLGGSTRLAEYPRPLNEVNEAGDRLLYAAWLYQQGKASQLVLSGGYATWTGPQGVPEAEQMASLLELMGVPRTALLLETVSRNTYENAVEVRKLLEPAGVKQIILVTSALHMPRSVAIFEAQAFEVLPAPTDFFVTDADWAYFTSASLPLQLINLIPSVDDLWLTSRALKEYIGLVVYRLQGWL
jgi:uncharacterized SAM-binding protein YcdF (DUF218 family)